MNLARSAPQGGHLVCFGYKHAIGKYLFGEIMHGILIYMLLIFIKMIDPI